MLDPGKNLIKGTPPTKAEIKKVRMIAWAKPKEEKDRIKLREDRIAAYEEFYGKLLKEENKNDINLSKS